MEYINIMCIITIIICGKGRGNILHGSRNILLQSDYIIFGNTNIEDVAWIGVSRSVNLYSGRITRIVIYHGRRLADCGYSATNVRFHGFVSFGRAFTSGVLFEVTYTLYIRRLKIML